MKTPTVRTRLAALVLSAAVGLASVVSLAAPAPVAAIEMPQRPPTLQLPDLAVDAGQAPTQVGFGQTFSYRFTVSRNVPLDRVITVRHTAPPGLTYLSASTSGDFTCSHTSSSGGHVLTCSGHLPNLNMSGSTTFTVNYRSPGEFDFASGNYLLRATVDPDKVEVHEVEADVNDPEFALAMANRLHELIEARS
jgi:hypothetical protein